MSYEIDSDEAFFDYEVAFCYQYDFDAFVGKIKKEKKKIDEEEKIAEKYLMWEEKRKINHKRYFNNLRLHKQKELEKQERENFLKLRKDKRLQKAKVEQSLFIDDDGTLKFDGGKPVIENFDEDFVSVEEYYSDDNETFYDSDNSNDYN